MDDIRLLTPEELLAGQTPTLDILQENLAIKVVGWWPAADCERAAAAVLAARDHWTSAFEGVQFSLGRAWYTHLERNRTELYFRRAAHSDEVVERFLPGMQRRMMELYRILTGQPVKKRAGWCGAGVHVFPAGEWLSENGGEIHFDVEGLTNHQIRDRVPALTAVLMLQPPTDGGGLRVWDQLYEDSDEITPAMLVKSAVTIPYGAGDLILIDSYRLHQIQPFIGELDRLSITCHAAYDGLAWETWF